MAVDPPAKAEWLQWMPAHRNLDHVGEPRFEGGPALTRLDLWANAAVDALAKEAAQQRRLDPAILKAAAAAAQAFRFPLPLPRKILTGKEAAYLRSRWQTMAPGQSRWGAERQMGGRGVQALPTVSLGDGHPPPQAQLPSYPPL